MDFPVTVPGTEEHKQVQRERILAAAQECFTRRGFHSASMATIAETASMSPGLIYRYFENKNAIILAIIDKQLTIARRRIRDMRSTTDLCGGILEYFNAHDTDTHGMNAALFMEIAAESTRDPEIKRAVGEFDEAVRRELTDWLQRDVDEGGYGLDAPTARERALSLVMVIEGLKVRKARQPDLDCALLKNSLDVLLAALDR